MSLTVTSTPRNDPPAVVLEISGAAAAPILRVVRTVGDTSLPVRGVRGSLVGSSGQVVDWEAPTGVTIIYEVTTLDADGGVVEHAVISVSGPANPPEGDWVWVSDPLDQTSPLLVHALRGTAESLSWEMSAEVSYPVGSRLGSAHIQQRRAANPVTLHLLTEGGDTDRLRRLLLGSALCVRFSSDSPAFRLLPPLLYGVCLAPIAKHHPGSDVAVWELAITPTRGPSMAAVVAGWSWDDLAASGMTWDQVAAAYADWYALARNEAL